MRVDGKRIEGVRERKIGALGSPDRNNKATEPDYSHCTNTEDSDDDSGGLVGAYEEIKALGDADHKVCALCSSRSLIDTLPNV